jgi:DNA ligase D-like protein (predicted 3'-phosphoesterase)
MQPDDETLTESPALYAMKLHRATKLHLDLRLERDGELISFALDPFLYLSPNKPTPADLMENHRISGLYWEGVRPFGLPGAGAVSVWDKGTYRNITVDNGRPVSIEEALRRGRLDIWIDGQKLRGGFSLRWAPSGSKREWEFVKLQDEYAGSTIELVSTQPRSEENGLTLEEIANGLRAPKINHDQINLAF